MDYNIKHDVPSFYLENDDTKKFLMIMQHGFEKMHDQVFQFQEIIDLEKADEKYLDLMLVEIGWILDVEATVQFKRKIIKIAKELYSLKGMKEGIIYAVKELMNINIELHDGVEQGFRLNNNRLGLKAYIGFAGYSFHLIVKTPVLNEDQENLLSKIIDFMRWAVTTFEIKQIL